MLTVLWFGAVAPLIEWHGERAEALTQREALAQHMLTLQAALPPLRQQAAAMAAGRAAEGGLLDGESDPAASAFMQERLQGMFMQAGVQLNSVETLPGEDVGVYRRIRLQVSFNASWPVLMELLSEIQLASPALVVNELQVQPALHRINTAPGTFDVSCTVFAFRLGTAVVAAR